MPSTALSICHISWMTLQLQYLAFNQQTPALVCDQYYQPLQRMKTSHNATVLTSEGGSCPSATSTRFNEKEPTTPTTTTTQFPVLEKRISHSSDAINVNVRDFAESDDGHPGLHRSNSEPLPGRPGLHARNSTVAAKPPLFEKPIFAPTKTLKPPPCRFISMCLADRTDVSRS